MDHNELLAGGREYGIAMTVDLDNQDEILHRGPMSYAHAQAWIEEWLDDGGDPEFFVIISRPTIVIISRPTSPWLLYQ